MLAVRGAYSMRQLKKIEEGMWGNDLLCLMGTGVAIIRKAVIKKSSRYSTAQTLKVANVERAFSNSSAVERRQGLRSICAPPRREIRVGFVKAMKTEGSKCGVRRELDRHAGRYLSR